MLFIYRYIIELVQNCEIKTALHKLFYLKKFVRKSSEISGIRTF